MSERPFRVVAVRADDWEAFKALAARRDKLRGHRNCAMSVGTGCILMGAVIQAVSPPGLHGIFCGLFCWVAAVVLHIAQHRAHLRLRARMAEVEDGQKP